MNFIENLTTLQKILLGAVVSITVYLLTTFASYEVFAQKMNQNIVQLTKPTPAQLVREDPQEPKTEECPLNGALHTKTAREAWEKRRPLGVMIENSVDSRPQSGLSFADVVYEAVAEGGITRFMAIFYCHLGDVQVGPVRSARTYFLDWISEYDGLYAHVGGANTPGPANALGQIIDYKIKSLNQFSIGFPTYWRDAERLGRTVAPEHTVYSTTEKLWEVAMKRNWGAVDAQGVAWNAHFIPWKFKDDQPKGQITKITVTFWSSQPDYQVTWVYDQKCNCYQRFYGDQPHIDLDNNQGIKAKVVVVRFMKESRANDGYENNLHLLYRNKGQGRALIFQDGQVIEGSWIKKTRVDRERFVDADGKEVALNRGLIWLETVPEGSEVVY